MKYLNENGEYEDLYPKSSGDVPSGLIAMWSGASNAIPNGWVLCNGENGTPDLRDKFVLGAGNSYSVGATGGEATHRLTISEMPSHSHSIQVMQQHDDYRDMYGRGYNGHMVSSSTGYAGGGQAHNNMPPYYALCFIMKQ